MTETITREETLPGTEDSIPCEIWRIARGKTCGQPAAARVSYRCPCGIQGRVFACAECLERNRGRLTWCTTCWQTVIFREC